MIFLISDNFFTAFVTAILFGVHPLHVESVVWISERKDVLYALFFLGSIIGYLYYLRSNLRMKYYFLSLFLFFLSLLSKTMSVTLLIILFLLDFYTNRKWDRRVLVEKIPFFVLSLIFGTIAIFAQAQFDSIRQEIPSLVNKIGIASYSVIFYLNKLFIPTRLSCLYPFSPIKNIFLQPVYLYSFLALIALIIGVIISGRYSKKIIFGSAFFLITISPVLQFIPFSKAIVADRYTYVASIGIFFIIAVFFLWARNKSAGSYYIKFITAATLILVIFNFASLTRDRCKIWQNSYTLWDDVINKYADEYIPDAYLSRGVANEQKGNLPQAISDYTKAIKIKANYAEAYYNRGFAYYQQGNLTQAISDYVKAIEIDHNYAKACNNLGVAYDRLANYAQAILNFNRAIEINPYFTEAYNNRGNTFSKQGNLSQAISSYSKAILSNPNDTMAYYNRGVAYFAAKEYGQAWLDVHKAEALGSIVNSEFLKALKKAMGDVI
jgi:tetratricopeptide (TPR) repeat protein